MTSLDDLWRRFDDPLARDFWGDPELIEAYKAGTIDHGELEKLRAAVGRRNDRNLKKLGYDPD